MWLWRREWQSTPVFLPGESQAQRSLAGYSPQGHKELDTTEWLIHTNHVNWGLFSQWFPPFLAGFVEEHFSTDQSQATVFGWFKGTYIYYALYFYYYSISSTSDHQALASGVGDLCRKDCIEYMLTFLYIFVTTLQWNHFSLEIIIHKPTLKE